MYSHSHMQGIVKEEPSQLSGEVTTSEKVGFGVIGTVLLFFGFLHYKNYKEHKAMWNDIYRAVFPRG